MNRLPGCDRTTHRSELAVFASLGLAGALMVALALAQMSQFVADSEHVTAALTPQRAPLTNAASAHVGRVGGDKVNQPAAARGGARGSATDKA